MIDEVEQLFNAVVAQAAADPQCAREILTAAAERFRATARHSQNVVANALYTYAAQLDEVAAEVVPRTTLNDFDELEREQAQAHEELAGADDLEIRARRDELAEVRKQRNHVSITPETVTGTTLLGTTATVTYNPTEAQRAKGIKAEGQVVMWQGAKEEAQSLTIDIDPLSTVVVGDGARTAATEGVIMGSPAGDTVLANTTGFAPSGTFIITDNEGNTHSVTYASIESWRFLDCFTAGPFVVAAGALIEQTPQPLSSRPYALIQFGTDGFMAPLFRVDIGRGTRITGAGNYVTVTVLVGPPAPGYLSAICTIGARLGFFAAGSQAPPIYTTFIDDLAADDVTDPIEVPVRARFILPPMSTDPSGSITINFLNTLGAIQSTLIVPTGSVVAPIPIVEGVVAITVRNTGPSTASFQIPWQIGC